MITWLPLETLPGWPEAPEVSNAWMVLLLFVLPLTFGAIVAVLAFGPTFAKRFRSDSGTSTDVARRDDQTGPDAYEVVQDAAVRHEAVKAGDDATPSQPTPA